MFNTRNFALRFLSLNNLVKKKIVATSKPNKKQTFPQFSCRHCSNIANTVESDDGSNIDYEAIANGDQELIHKLKVIALETEVMRQEGRAVPENKYINKEHWKELMSLPSRSGRRKYLEHLFKLSKKKENEEAKKLEKRKHFEIIRQERELKKNQEESFEDFVSTYDLQHNNIFMRFRDTTMNNMYNNRLIQAIRFGQKLVIDCGYTADMTKRENMNCAKQLMYVFAENRLHDEPFDLHFCNADRYGILLKQFEKHIPTLYEPWFPLNVHECSYLDVFPKDQLVYLTPHCQEEMKEFDPEAVYIIGGIVDKVNNEPLSLAKAKKEGLKMQKLPLDRYLLWGSGSGKSLTLNQVTRILLDINQTGDWQKAFEHVPRRKLAEHIITENVRRHTSPFNSDHRARKKWIPTSNINFNALSYGNKNRQGDTKLKDRLVNINSFKGKIDI